MSQKTLTHQIKLPLSLTIILGLIAFGLIANVLKPVVTVDKAIAVEALTSSEVRKIVEDWCRVSKRSLRIYCDKKR
jgi:hypothetical protein